MVSTMLKDKRALASPLHWLPQALKDRARGRELAAGEYLFRQGDAASAIYEIQRGRLRMIRYTSDSRPVIVHTARQGQLFAEAALFADTYHCDAVATADTRVRIYAKKPLLAALRSEPELALHLTSVLAREVRALRERLEVRNVRSARERIIQHLALMADAGALRLDGPLKDLAAEIGLTPEAYYRALAALEKEGAIARTGDRIVLRRGDLPRPPT
jgi:CRP-like cAMP-binding protein